MLKYFNIAPSPTCCSSMRWKLILDSFLLQPEQLSEDSIGRSSALGFTLVLYCGEAKSGSTLPTHSLFVEWSLCLACSFTGNTGDLAALFLPERQGEYAEKRMKTLGLTRWTIMLSLRKNSSIALTSSCRTLATRAFSA